MTLSVKCGILFSILLLVGTSFVFGFANTEVPDAEIKTTGTQYISPNNDGIQDSSALDFTFKVYVKSDAGYVPEYGIQISNSAGVVVWEKVEQEESDIGWFLQIFRAWEEFTLDKSVTWDGIDSNGSLVPDGTYSVDMWVIADSEQRSDFKLDEFVVDTQTPTVDIGEPESFIFSPNGDGNLETIAIPHSGGSIEDEWSAAIIDSSNTKVKNYTWRNVAPDSIVWDGTADDGRQVSDGDYRYEIEATDRAGNSFSYNLSGLELDTIETPIAVSVDLEFLSSNGDGKQDELMVALSQEVARDILEWRLVVDDGEGTVLREYGGEGDPPAEVIFDGLDNAGRQIRDGLYRVLYGLEYRHGNQPFATDQFIVDLTVPTITVSITERILSPNGDGRFEETQITFKSSEKVTWEGGIFDESDNPVLTTSWLETTSLIVWRGTGADDAVVEDGDYYLEATFTDPAGNSYTTPREKFSVDLTPPAVSFEIDKDYFSPDKDGVLDTLSASITTDEAARGVLRIFDSTGREVGTLGGLSSRDPIITDSFTYNWEGVDLTGKVLPDGRYSVSSSYEDAVGNRTSLPAKSFTIDTRPVSLSLTAPAGFSPNKDGIRDQLPLSVDAGIYDTVVSWKLEYVDLGGRAIDGLEGSGTLPNSFDWDGSMRFVDPDVEASEGRYTARLQVEYLKGNVIEASTDPFFIDVTPPAVRLEATADPFVKLNGDMEGDIFITMHIDDAHEVVGWELDVLSSDETVLRSFTGSGDLKDQVLWQDREEKVTSVPISDRVLLEVNVQDEVGNSSTFEHLVPLDLLIVQRDGKLYLMVPNVIFGAYQHELDSRGPEFLTGNLDSIERVVTILDKYSRYRLLLEGHALNIYRGDSAKEIEEEEILVPLTERRATTVREALIDQGLGEERIEMEWFGGTRPIVDVKDREVRWKNRRVEFIMLEP